jgi:hypothetical protein
MIRVKVKGQVTRGYSRHILIVTDVVKLVKDVPNHVVAPCNIYDMQTFLKVLSMQGHTERNEFESEAARAMRDVAMLLHLRRPLMDTVTLCAFDNIREPTTPHKRCKERRSVCLTLILLMRRIG